MTVWSGLPEWAQYLMQGLLLFAMMASAAVALARAGRSPYWALATLIPYNFAMIALIWAFAFCRWPGLEEKGKAP